MVTDSSLGRLQVTAEQPGIAQRAGACLPSKGSAPALLGLHHQEQPNSALQRAQGGAAPWGSCNGAQSTPADCTVSSSNTSACAPGSSGPKSLRLQLKNIHQDVDAKIHDANLVSLQPLSAQPREAKDTQRAPEAIAEGPGGVWGSMCHLSSCSQGHHSPTPCAQPAGAMGAQMLCSFSACKFSSRALALPSCGLRASLLLAGDPWDTTMLSHIPLQAPTVMVLFQHYLL